jgi:DNA repair protein RecN (Recombination protein N)
MLVLLSIRDFVLIEKLELEFSRSRNSGLGALTGETGAGKSILIDALGLALGARADTAAIRRGAAQASVAASFDLPKHHPAHAILSEQGLDDDDVLTLRRTVGADGRGRAFVNDQPASVALLRRLGDTLVEIQGQMEQHGLLDLATHRASLDALPGWRSRPRRFAAPGKPGAQPNGRASRQRPPPPRRGATRISCGML